VHRQRKLLARVIGVRNRNLCIGIGQNFHGIRRVVRPREMEGEVVYKRKGQTIHARFEEWGGGGGAYAI
jgi:hypothetical protein